MCCPYPLVVIPGILVLLAICFTSYSSFACDYFRIEDASIEVGKKTDLQVGLWTIQDVNPDYLQLDSGSSNSVWGDDNMWDEDRYECVGWNERSLLGPASMVELDGSMSAARAFSLLAFLLGMFGMVLICIPCCFSFDEPRKYGKILVTTYTITGLLVLLSLVALSSDICKNAESCEIDTAGVIGILASVFWFISAGLVLLTLKWPRNADSFFSTGYPVEAVAAQPAPTIEREVRSVTNEDGSTTTVTRTTVTHPDGSKNVTETTETSEPHPIAESVPLGSDAVPLAASMPAPEETTPTASVLSVVQEPVAATKAAP